MPKWFLNNCLLACILLTNAAPAQKSDAELLRTVDFSKPQYDQKREVTYLFRGRHPLVKYNPVSLVFGGMMYVYQKTISVQIGAACPYEISCSHFSKLCINRYGLLKGIPLTADRLTRCTRLAGYDLIGGVDYSTRKGRIYDEPEDYRSAKK